MTELTVGNKIIVNKNIKTKKHNSKQEIKIPLLKSQNVVIWFKNIYNVPNSFSRKRKPKTYDQRPRENLRTPLHSCHIKPCFNQQGERLKSLPFQQAEVY